MGTPNCWLKGRVATFQMSFEFGRCVSKEHEPLKSVITSEGDRLLESSHDSETEKKKTEVSFQFPRLPTKRPLTQYQNERCWND